MTIIAAVVAGVLIGAGLLAAGFRAGYMLGKHGIITRGTVSIHRKGDDK